MWREFRAAATSFPQKSVLQLCSALDRRWKHLARATRQRYMHSLVKLLRYHSPVPWRIDRNTAFLLLRSSLHHRQGVKKGRGAAVPATPKDVITLLNSTISADTKRLVTWAWISASRFDDIVTRGANLHISKHSTELFLPSSKSDLHEVGFTKFIHHHQAKNFKLTTLPQVPYRTALNDIKSITPTLSLHSFRRGAATYLASKGYNMRKIVHLTGHQTPQTKSMQILSRYIVPHRKQRIPRIQIELSGCLMHALTHHSRTSGTLWAVGNTHSHQRQRERTHPTRQHQPRHHTPLRIRRTMLHM